MSINFQYRTNIILIPLFLSCVVSVAAAQELNIAPDILKLREQNLKKIEATEKKAAADQEGEKKLPKSGSLSDSGSGYSGTTLGGTWGGDALAKTPISGSVSKKNGDEWQLKLFNTSEDRYQVSVSVVQYDANNRKVKSDAYPYTLNPAQSVQRVFRVSAITTRCSLELNNWKKFPRQKSAEELQQEIEQKKKELEELESQIQ